MDGRYGSCYAVGCTARHRQGEGKLVRFPRIAVRAKEWAQNVGRLCMMKEAGSLHHKYLCRDHVLPTDFMAPEGMRLNRMAVPLGLDSASHSIPQSSPPLLPTLSNSQPSAVSPQNSNLPVLPPLPLTSELPPEENNLQVLPPLRTYSKLPLSSTRIETPLPIHIDGTSSSSPISVPNPEQAAANIFSVEDTSLSLSLDFYTASSAFVNDLCAEPVLIL